MKVIKGNEASAKLIKKIDEPKPDVLENIEKLLKQLLERKIPAPIVNIAPPNVDVKPPEVKIENKASDVQIKESSKYIEMLVNELILQKKQPVEVVIEQEESGEKGWDEIEFTITRDEKDFMKKVKARRIK